MRSRSRRSPARGSAPASTSASPPRRRWKNARSTGSGRTGWAPRWRCAAASARSCSTRGAVTGPSLASTTRWPQSPQTAAAAVRAMVKTHAALKADVSRATEIGRKLFPPSEAELIAELIRRDLPYYDATISRDFVAGMNQFSRDVGILKGDVPYEGIVATQVSKYWNS